ncbi:DNA-binding protein [[Clostridium] sordellii]|uniref:helix-turn-helix domain-containing protein n=1 Tax=Paraclostridium sordellii TaxID=1505 RepID=UPI0005E81978|nr:helix-turn-helix transcriptional regulator [Paeniclostridium sordellii]CEO04824.1 DNA-binding protein [[Clostridium] sordellii] [Paeniclostridium sordellii]
MKFAEILRKERVNLGLNQVEFAKIFNVTKQTVSNWENGNRNPDSATLSKLADYFGVTVDYLLGRTDESTINKEKAKLDQSVKTIAAHRLGDVEDLDDNAIEKINEYIEFIRLQQNKNKL